MASISAPSAVTVGEPSSVKPVVVGEPSSVKPVAVGAPSSVKPVPVGEPSSLKPVPVGEPSSVKAVAAGGPGNVTPTHQEVGQALVAQPGTAAEDENKNPWVLVTYRNTGRVHRQGGQVLQVVYQLPDLECQAGVPWVQTGRTIRAQRKLSMARKGGMTVTSDGEDAIWLYGSYGPYGIEF